ncbi:MAG: 4-(cytidine 5'-diphospho)-2-C-methyl-D-erythritol kinase, partial [Paraclostridium sp.]
LGADVPFCIEGGTALAEGIGEKLTYIKGLNENVKILVCKPDIFVSTKEVYEALDIANIEKRPDNNLLIESLKIDDIESVSKNMVNVLEEVTSKKYGDIEKIENVIMKNGAIGTMMSGSGPTVFGFFDSEENALRAKVELLDDYSQVYVVTSSKKGVEIDG